MTLSHHNLHHLSTDSLLLRILGITSSSNLLACSSSEANAEHSKHISIGSLTLNECFDNCVPFLHKLAEFVSCDVHSMEIGIAVVPFDFFNLYLHFSPIFIIAFVLEISQRYFKYSAFQTISWEFYISIIFNGKLMELLYPAVLLQGVIVGIRTSNTVGTWTLYHSFLINGWALFKKGKGK